MINYSFATLHEFAIPTKGIYSKHIGQVIFGQYQTLVMTQTGDIVTGKNTYKMIQGYILVKPLAEQFQKSNKDAKIRQISHWGRSKNSISKLESETPLLISIEGSNEIKGTYFRPDIVLDVLEWLCPAFKSDIKSVYENHIVEQNAVRQATNNALEESKESVELVKKNVRFLDENQSESDFEDECDGITLFELEQQLKQLKEKREIVQDLKEFKQLTAQIDDLTTQIRNAELEEQLDIQRRNQYKGTLYELYKKGQDKPFYVGITDQKAKKDDSSEQVRFNGHIQQCIDILKTPGCDYTHLYMLGEMIKYAQMNGISKQDIKPTDYFQLFESKMIASDVQDREQLEQMESDRIQERIKQGCVLMNMKKNSQYGTRTRSQTRKQQESKEEIKPVQQIEIINPNQCPKCKIVFKRLASHKCK